MNDGNECVGCVRNFEKNDFGGMNRNEYNVQCCPRRFKREKTQETDNEEHSKLQ